MALWRGVDENVANGSRGKPALAGADDWTHYDYGPNSNDASNDELSGYSRGLQYWRHYGGDGGYGLV